MNAPLIMDLGSMLLEKKLVTPEQLKRGIEQQKIHGGYLSQHLIELGYIEDAELTAQLTCNFGFYYLPLRTYQINKETITSIPHQIMCDYCVVPVEKHDKLLTVAMSDPLNKGVIEVLRQVSGCEIIVFISTRREISDTIKHALPGEVKAHILDHHNTDKSLRDNLNDPNVTDGFYSGRNRRRYKRLGVNLTGEYFVYPNIVRTEVKNVSMSGVLFEANKPLDQGSQMAMHLHLNDGHHVSGVVQVARLETKKLINILANNKKEVSYEVGAFFNFMSKENQNMLAEFIKKKISKSSK